MNEAYFNEDESRTLVGLGRQAGRQLQVGILDQTLFGTWSRLMGPRENVAAHPTRFAFELAGRDTISGIFIHNHSEKRQVFRIPLFGFETEKKGIP